jgi:hypothetical protein
MSEEIVTPDVGTNEQVSIDTNTPPLEKGFRDFIPETFQDKEYLKSIDSFDSLFNQFDNAQKLIGKRQVPGADAPAEDWEKYYSQVRPESSEQYEFDKVDGINRSPEMENDLKGIFHKAGLSSAQAKMVQTEFDTFAAKHLPNEQKMNEEFDTIASEVFGDRVDEAIDTSRKLMAKYAPEKFKGELAKLGNIELVTMASILDQVAKNHISEDEIPRGGAAGSNAEDLRTKARGLMASDAYKDPFHAEHETIKTQVKDLYSRMN